MTEFGGAAGKRLEVRKYPNRRYYDATHSRHLTLEEIRALICDGYDITVTDSKTGADITAQVLTQIILELEPPKIATLPVTMLVQMIRANERVVGDFITNYFEEAFKSYLDYHEQMQERFRQMHAAPGPFGPLNAFAQFFTPPTNPGAAAAPGKPHQQAADEDLRAIIAELRQQVAELRQEREGKGKRARGKT